MKIATKYNRLQSKICKILLEIEELRALCPHENLTYKLCGSTGHWDRSDDSYWIDWSCQDCGKKWTTDQKQRLAFDY